METAVDSALEAGYRHFDTAFMYDAEEFLGKSIQKWIQAGKGTRQDLFITSKVPPFYFYFKYLVLCYSSCRGMEWNSRWLTTLWI
jgi:diketogulonate reductase-like aldo/keto reductase